MFGIKKIIVPLPPTREYTIPRCHVAKVLFYLDLVMGTSEEKLFNKMRLHRFISRIIPDAEGDFLATSAEFEEEHGIKVSGKLSFDTKSMQVPKVIIEFIRE